MSRRIYVPGTPKPRCEIFRMEMIHSSSNAMRRFQSLIPDWVTRSASDVFLHGHLPQLSALQQGQVGIVGLAVGACGVVLFLTVGRLKQRFFPQPFYDQRLVAQKTSRVAYRVR